MQEKSLCETISLKYPIIQAPMAGGILDADFVANVSNFGMLGSIPSGYLTLQQLENFIVEVKNKTTNPFQVNIFVDYTNQQRSNFKKPKELVAIEKEIGSHNSDFFTIPPITKVDEILELVVKHNIQAVSTTFGALRKEDIKKLKDNNIFIMSTINSVSEAKIAIFDQKVDSVVFQNIEAGGHKGGFLDEKYSEAISLIKLKKQSPDVFFIFSGGLANKTDIKEAISHGYDGTQLGTGFLMTQESLASDLYKKKLLEIKNSNQTIITKSITGKKARGLRNKLAELKMEEQLPYPLLHYATKNIRDFAKKNKLVEYQSIWAGTSSAKIESVPSLRSYMRSLI